MKRRIKAVYYGFLVWLIPFVVSFFFVDQNGRFLIPETFFKTIMVVTGALAGVFFAVRYFRNVKSDHVNEAIILGAIWLLVNWILDLLLVYSGFFDMSITSYFTDIGLRYLAMPIYAIGLGYALKAGNYT